MKDAQASQRRPEHELVIAIIRVVVLIAVWRFRAELVTAAAARWATLEHLRRTVWGSTRVGL